MLGSHNTHLEHFLRNKAKDGEKALATMPGWIGDVMGQGKNTQHNGAFLLTDQRVAFVRKGFFGEVFETIPLDKITSVETRSFMGHRVLTCHTSHDELRFKSFEAKAVFDEVHRMVEDLRQPKATTPTSAPPSGLTTDLPSQIQQLANLRAAGVLTDDEFERAKARLLGG
ncbi:SHOCT domain-containing protein [Pararoseomonas sp. SCSIO 73927]|uniref:SHOCT domain-containing protein n=1 Tax=Pararoseomonas sp. SCSIO 73927 TaxID=3114537 RepID=UPI0030CB44FB